VLYCATDTTEGGMELSLALLLFTALTFCTRLKLTLLEATENSLQ